MTIYKALCCVFTASLGLTQMPVKQTELWTTIAQQEEMARKNLACRKCDFSFPVFQMGKLRSQKGVSHPKPVALEV